MIFVDTGPFLGRSIKKDQHHADATAGWDRLERSGTRIVTSSFVLDEYFTLLARRTDYAFASRKARLVYASSVIEILRPDRAEEERAIDLFEKFASEGVSFTDCVSFVLMRKHKLRRVFGFDRHFVEAGFELWPGRE